MQVPLMKSHFWFMECNKVQIQVTNSALFSWNVKEIYKDTIFKSSIVYKLVLFDNIKYFFLQL